MNTTEKNLRALGRPYVTLADISRAIAEDAGIDANSFPYRVRDLPPEEKPEAWGAFRAGATTTFTLDAAITWVNHHMAWWDDYCANNKYLTKRNAERRVGK